MCGIKPIVNKIYAYGNIKLLSSKSIAIVGSRNSSEYGCNMAKKITADLVRNGIVIVSGIAIGIDTIAHRTCLENNGKTIAVLGSGFKHIFPKENTELFHKIIDNGGLVLSELPIDEPVQKKNFPRRNRIISAISDGVLVVEAAYRSGTSITARYARAQNKKVFCIPNCIGNKNSYGTIEQIKKGAYVITSASDILKEMGVKVKGEIPKIKRVLDEKIKKYDTDEKRVFFLLKEYGDLNGEQVANKLNISIVKVNQILTLLELDGIIENCKINKYRLSKEYCE